METSTVGEVVVRATLENLWDLSAVELGALKPDDVRRVEIEEAHVDTGATMLCLPKSTIDHLGLTFVRTRKALTANGIVDRNVYSQVKLTIQGRDSFETVAEVPESCPVLIGQLPLEHLDWVVDPINQRLIGNPAHGGEHMIEMY